MFKATSVQKDYITLIGPHCHANKKVTYLPKPGLKDYEPSEMHQIGNNSKEMKSAPSISKLHAYSVFYFKSICDGATQII